MSEEIIKLIEKFLSQTLSEEEMKELLSAYHQKRISEEQFEAYYAGKWSESGSNPSPLANETKEKAWKLFREHIHQNGRIMPKHKNRWIAVASVAAVAVLFFMLGISVPLFRDKPQQELIVTVENGQKASVRLPDGSHVWLNSASELRYSPDFGKKNRTLQLVGEAYFDVKSNPENPFIVLTRDNLQVRATGTKFNVKSYPNDELITSTLIEGKIEVNDLRQSEVLAPYDQITYNAKAMRFSKSHIDNSEEAVFWMTNQFVFEKETLESIAKMLERMYNITVSFASPDIKEIQYSGKIKNNSMENVLNLITFVSPLQYTMDDSHITFSKK